MNTLSRELRKLLEKKILEARSEAEKGAGKALQSYAVHEAEPYASMSDEQKKLRLRLRAHGRQVGDITADDKRQEITRLKEECAYEHWHRMLFARFLAENHLLLDPETQSPISLDECRKLAAEQGSDWVALASEFAQRMLPRIFRSDDPLLRISLPQENRIPLEKLLEELPSAIFTADDSLGWVYQFWQAQRKDKINKSGEKIGAREVAPVTQLFTEDYMVLFLLHNTLGAWWTAKRRQEGKTHELPGYEWTYLRFKEDGSPAAGAFEGWPRTAREVTVLDPCMGSGHFLVFALPILVKMRMEEEGISNQEAICAVLRDNLFGLELDPRCTQIAAFNLALASWKMADAYFGVPRPNLACSGLSINAEENDWVKLAGEDQLLRETMKELYQLFKQAPIIGSLINPKRVGGHLFAVNFEKARWLLQEALAAERKDFEENELAITAHGIVEAAHILANQFTLIATNVPYLGLRKQCPSLKEYCERFHFKAKQDLATCFIERCIMFCANDAATALVTPQNWLFLSSYKSLRSELLERHTFGTLVRLGAGAFETIGGEVVNVVLLVSLNSTPKQFSTFLNIDVSKAAAFEEKAKALRSIPVTRTIQSSQKANPDSRITGGNSNGTAFLESFVISPQGVKTGDDPKWKCCFWEFCFIVQDWRFYQAPVEQETPFGGREHVLDWRTNGIGMVRPRLDNKAVGQKGVAISAVGQLVASLYAGEHYDSGVATIVPIRQEHLPALWAFCSSHEFKDAVRVIDKKVAVTNMTLVKVPFDLFRWKQVAEARYPQGLPQPYSNDLTQWLFNGHPINSEKPLQVAVARLLGYRWPRQTGSSFMDCPALADDGLESFAEENGIVCLHSLKGHRSAAERLKELLAAAYGSEWCAQKLTELLKQAGATSPSLEDWLRDEFFEKHCEVFHQRPFIWHVWDGLKNGFHALVNYHKLAAPNDESRRTLDNLIYGYLGDWIQRKQAEQKRGEPGAEGQLAAADHLQKQLIKIMEGESPYDIFVRWKPLHEQAIGWEPDINDGVRMNIRPFIMAKPFNAKGKSGKSGKSACILRVAPRIKWEKDRGKEPIRSKDDFPWFYGWDGARADFMGDEKFDGNRWNDLHYSLAIKQKAREKHAAAKKKGQGA